jgi:hypothetical protein
MSPPFSNLYGGYVYLHVKPNISNLVCIRLTPFPLAEWQSVILEIKNPHPSVDLGFCNCINKRFHIIFSTKLLTIYICKSSFPFCCCLVFLLISQGIPLVPHLPQGDDEADQPPDHQCKEEAQARDVNISLTSETTCQNYYDCCALPGP